MESRFRLRCVSALTHPATLAALAVLLVNDLLLKALWPSAWVPGKLSDLAWMTFAPPLLAFALSLATRRRPLLERAAFLAAYAGLPLLYAAFNTFASVHDAIIARLLLLSGAASGSPLDPTDSLVIPAAMAIALWVWRRPAVDPSGVRSRLGLLAAVAAAFATVATSPSPVALGVTSVWVDPGGTAKASAGYLHFPDAYFESTDGGLTWERLSEPVEKPWDQQQVTTPRGSYAIHGAGIVLSPPGSPWSEVYSTSHLDNDANRWTQAVGIQRRAHPIAASEWTLTTMPVSIAYHANSGNVIVAMGMQGVVVGTPDELWTEAAVGPYAPVDFSAQAKLRLLSADILLWLLALAVAAGVTSLAMALSFNRYRGEDLLLGGGIGFLLGVLLLPLVEAESDAAGIESTGLLLFPALFILTLPLLGTLRSDATGRMLRLTVAIFALTALSHAYLTGFFIGYTDRDSLFVSGRYTQICLSIPALLLAPTTAIAHAARLRERRVLFALLSGFAGVFVSTAVAVLWWLMAGTSVAFGLVVVFVLSGLITFVLVRYLQALPEPENQAPVEHRRRTLAHAGHVVMAVGATFFVTPFMGLVVYFFFSLGVLAGGLLLVIATTLVAVGVAVALVRFMGLALTDRPDTGPQRRWRIILIAGLSLVGLASLVSTHNASWVLVGFGVFFFDESLVLWGLIAAVVLSILVALGLVRYLARLQAVSEDDDS